VCPNVKDLDPPAIADWMAAHPERAAATHRSLLSSLRAACSYGDFKEYLRSPFRFRHLDEWLPGDELEGGELFPRHRTGDEIRRVLCQADLEAQGGSWEALRLRAAVYAWAYTGADKTAILGLARADIDLERKTIVIRSRRRRRLKTAARIRRLPIAEALLAVLREWIPHSGCEWVFPHSRKTGPWLHGPNGRKALDQVRQLGERAEVEGLTILAFRHSFATLAEGWGIGELMLMRILGHSRPETQRRYRHEEIGQLLDAAAKIHF
jgi:integrase